MLRHIEDENNKGWLNFHLLVENNILNILFWFTLNFIIWYFVRTKTDDDRISFGTSRPSDHINHIVTFNHLDGKSSFLDNTLQIGRETVRCSFFKKIVGVHPHMRRCRSKKRGANHWKDISCAIRQNTIVLK